MRIDDSCFRRILHLRYPTPDDVQRAATATETSFGGRGDCSDGLKIGRTSDPSAHGRPSPCSGPTILRSSVQRGGTSASGRCERVPNKHKNELLELLKQLLHSVERVNGTTVTVRPLECECRSFPTLHFPPFSPPRSQCSSAQRPQERRFPSAASFRSSHPRTSRIGTSAAVSVKGLL